MGVRIWARRKAFGYARSMIKSLDLGQIGIELGSHIAQRSNMKNLHTHSESTGLLRLVPGLNPLRKHISCTASKVDWNGRDDEYQSKISLQATVSQMYMAGAQMYKSFM